ncbi:hypothetical protein [Streptomyces sp. IGB124]|uniref:hypothetical protein n=1 Tax=Streptomyces sp. IGB124 TaxID=1519485 RepID=UPI0006AE2AC7|nr:hypothetical protein [Streptomyces sp. IGB124]KOU62119.1 hypothetical protein ADK96_27270 [Streptomyces sp. IGB124]
MTRPLPSPLTPVGFRRDGRPIYPILGAAPNDPSDGGDPADPPAQTVSQDDLNRLLAREKTQGGRAAVKKLLVDLGFDTAEALGEFITTKREADQAALSEIERREQAAAERERQADQRLADAEAREHAAVRRAVLAGLGASGDDLADAVVLIERALADQPEADEAAVTAVAEQLKTRRPGLFGQQSPPPAPGGSPAGGPPSRGGLPPRPGAAGLEMARRRGFVND